VAKGKRDEKIDAVPADGLARKARQDYQVLPENKKRNNRTVDLFWVNA
jgi:hypothetical protein